MEEKSSGEIEKVETVDPNYANYVMICNEEDLVENRMVVYNYDGNNKVLVVKQKDDIMAVGAICPHKGGLLHLGVLGPGRVRCPWHGACFDLNTGDIEDYPGMDSLPFYEVEVGRKGEVRVRPKRKYLNQIARVKEMAVKLETDERCYVGVGGGTATAIWAETLRQEGYTGRIVILCGEKYPPYDRIHISKKLDLQMDTLLYRNAEFYEENGIKIMLNSLVTNVNTKEKRVTCGNELELQYDQIFIATGCRPKKPELRGIDLENVFILQDYDDYIALNAVLNRNTRLVFLGSGLTALETAALQAGRVKSIVIIDQAEFSLSRTYGDVIGDAFKELFARHGVTLELNASVSHIASDVKRQKIKNIVLGKNKRLPCDVIVISAGYALNTEFLENSGLKLNENGSIDTDMHLRTVIPNVYVGGDIANAPVLTRSNERLSIAHQQIAQYHGRIAGLNMAGVIEDVRTIPFFDFKLFGNHFKQTGYGTHHDVYIDGDVEKFDFTAYLMDEDGNIFAVATCNRELMTMYFAEMCQQGKRLHISHILEKETPTSWIEMINDEGGALDSCVC